MFRRQLSQSFVKGARRFATKPTSRFASKWTACGLAAGMAGAAAYYSLHEGQFPLAYAAGEAPAKGKAVSLMGAQSVHTNLPVELAQLAYAPHVPPPITRRHPVLLRVDITYDGWIAPLTRKWKYEFWGFNGHSPGPFIRARVGDVMEVNVTNNEPSGMPHNIDFHAVDGPGGGAPLLLADQGQTKSAQFKLTTPGLYVYHCAAAPIPLHIANGMYGLILVEPEGGLPKVDKEYYVMQSEFYLEPPEKGSNVATPAYDMGLKEEPEAIVFNGREGSMTDKEVLTCNIGDRVRLFVGNGGPNIMSSFHVIGTIFDKCYQEGDLVAPPARCVQTTVIPPGGSAVVEMDIKIPGNYTMVDHALFRLDKGCVGFLQAKGDPQPQLYHSIAHPTPCPGCKIHP